MTDKEDFFPREDVRQAWLAILESMNEKAREEYLAEAEKRGVTRDGYRRKEHD